MRRVANASEHREGSVEASKHPTQAKIGLKWATGRSSLAKESQAPHEVSARSHDNPAQKMEIL